MSTFKIKEKKRGRYKDIKTLDAKHKEHIQYFKDLKDSLPIKKTELDKLKHKLSQIEDTPLNFTKIINIKDEIFEMEKNIKDIESNYEEKNYYLNNGELLYQYYDTKNRIGGTVASSVYLMMQGIQILRIHDVNELLQGVKVFKELIKN